MTLVAVLVLAVALAFLGAIGPDPFAILGTLGVVLVATLGANEIAARLARSVPHRESSVITARIITCLVLPSLTTAGLAAAAVRRVSLPPGMVVSFFAYGRTARPRAGRIARAATAAAPRATHVAAVAAISHSSRGVP